jgi:hypothetical protein
MLGHWLKNSRRTLSSLDGCKVNQILLNNKEIIIKHSTLLRKNSATAPINIRKASPQGNKRHTLIVAMETAKH